MNDTNATNPTSLSAIFNPALKASIAIFGVVGNPVAHSRSPIIHQLFAAQINKSLDYQRIQSTTASFNQDIKDFFSMGGQGLNITLPFKTLAYTLCLEQHSAGLTPRARRARAVNTLWLTDGKLCGDNTDGVGLVRDLHRQGALLQGQRILIVGAGGAAQGVIGPLLEKKPACLWLVNRDAKKAQLLGELEPQLHTGALSAAAEQSFDIVINATAAGLNGLSPDLPIGIYGPNALAYDMLYSASNTPFMLQAQNQGASKVCDGLGMLVEQAAASFLIWHGVHPNTALVLNHLRLSLSIPILPEDTGL